MNYATNSENYIDLFFNVNALLNFILQTSLGPSHIACKISIISLVLVNLLRLLSVMRIFPALTPMVIMLSRVIVDLSYFFFFFFQIIFTFALIMDVLGVGNVNIEGKFRDEFKDCDLENFVECASEMPGVEFSHLGLFFGNIYQVFRLSVGDYAVIDLVNYLPAASVIIFWYSWVIVVIVNSVFFLNIIVAEASNSYQKVVDTLDQVVLQEQTALIAESDLM